MLISDLMCAKFNLPLIILYTQGAPLQQFLLPGKSFFPQEALGPGGLLGVFQHSYLNL